MLDNQAAAGVYAATPKWWWKTEPHTAIPVVHIAPPGTSVGMSGGWSRWVGGQVHMVAQNRCTAAKVDKC